jgi:hypothetical protein
MVTVAKMSDWPPPDRKSAYVPPTLAAPQASEVEQRAAIAAARIREGLAVSDEILSEIFVSSHSTAQAGIFTPAEREDIYGDHERVERARAVLGDAEEVLGGLQVCWVNGQRGIRVLLSAEHDRYRQQLSAELGTDRVVVDRAAMTERESRRLQEEIHAARSELADQGIFVTRNGQAVDGFALEYLAWDPGLAEGTLRDRFGGGVTLRYLGASNHTFSPFPFASWHAEDHLLHVFYGLPRNGERPGDCQAFDDDGAVVVALTVKDWRGAKTLVGGFIPSHATVRLTRPLGDRVVIDDSANRARPHWTHT